MYDGLFIKVIFKKDILYFAGDMNYDLSRSHWYLHQLQSVWKLVFLRVNDSCDDYLYVEYKIHIM